MHRGVILPMFVLCAACCGAHAAPPVAPVQDDAATTLRSYYSGNGFLNRGLYDLAAAEYRQFLEEHPDHASAPVARYGLAVSLFRLGKYDEAERELLALQETAFPYAVEAAMILGECHLVRERFADAAAVFAEVRARHNDHDLADDAAALEAEALYRLPAYERVEQPCAALIERWPQSPRRERAELLWGLSEMALGRHAAAADRFAKLAERFPEGEHADQTALLLAQALHRAGAAERAGQQYRAVIDDAAERWVPEAMYGLGTLLHQEGEFGDAGEALDAMLRRFDDHDLAPAARLLRGRAWFDEQRYDRAATLFAEVAGSDRDELADDAAYWHAKCDLRSGRPGQAAERLEAARQRWPESELVGEINYDLAVALVRDGQAEEALEVLAGFLERWPDHQLAAEALHLTLLTEHQQGDHQRAIELANLFRTRHPNHPLGPAVAFVAAESRFLAGDYAAAAAACARFLERWPEHPQATAARYRQGMACYHLDRFQEAEPLLAAVAEGRQTPEPYRAALLGLGDGWFQRGEWAAAQPYFEQYLFFGLDQQAADDALLKLALSRDRQGRHEAAIEAYDQLLANFDESPHRLQAIFERGQALVALQRTEDARAAFAELLEQGPESRYAPHARMHLGALAMAAGDPAGAAEHYAGAAQNHEEPDRVAEAMFQQGQALMAAERFDEASAVFALIAEAHGGSTRAAEAAALEAVALSRNGEHERALERIEQLQRRHRDRLPVDLVAAVAYEQAWCQRELGQLEKAEASYRELLALETTSPLRLHGLLELGELQITTGELEQAAADLQRLRAMCEQRSDVPAGLLERTAYQQGVCAYRMEQWEQAAQRMEQFLDTWPLSEREPSARLLAGEALFHLGRHERAVERLEPLVAHHREHEAYGPALLRLGECLAVLQRWEASEARFREYLKEFAQSPQWYQAQFGIGWALDNRGRTRDAIDAYRVVVDRHQGPTAARAQFQIGECLYAEKRYEDAVRELLKVDILYAYPQWSAAAIYEAGRCFEELAAPADARKQYEQVVQKHADTHWAKLSERRLEELAKTGLPGRR